MCEMNHDLLINTEEAIRYLGYGNDSPDDEMLLLLHESEKKLMDVVNPQYIIKECELIRKDDGILAGESKIHLSGDSIHKYLKDCKRMYFCCATLSEQVDDLIDVAQKRDMLEALLIDASANAAIENLRMSIEADLTSQCGNDSVRPMFGFGYGDLSVSLLPKVLEFLDSKNKINVYANHSFALIPSKSVCGIIAVKEKNDTDDTCSGRCVDCMMEDRCTYYKK